MTMLLELSMLALGATIFGALWRLWRGPTVPDRMLAFDLITVCAVGWIAVLSVRWRTELFLDLVLVYSLLGFLGTVALALYLDKTIAPRRPGQSDPPESELDHD